MDADTILKYTLLVVSVALSVVILLQAGKGGGLGTAFGGSSGGESFRSKRGTEALLFNSTIVLSILFAVLSLAIAIVNA